MDFSDYLDLLRKFWLSIVVVTLAGVLAATGFCLLTKPTYTAQTAVLLSVRDSNGVSDLTVGATYATNQAQSFARLATTSAVLQPVIDGLSLGVSAADLAKSVTATVPTNTAIVNISVVNNDAARSAAIAQGVGEQLAAQAQQLLPRDAHGNPMANATVVSVAAVPTVPTSPKVALNLALGALLGLLVGIGQAIVRKGLDVRVRTGEDIAQVTDRSVIARIPHDRTVSESPVAFFSNPQSPRAEAYRRLRTNLRFLIFDEHNSCLVVTSSVVGEGKTTTALNIAIAIAEGGNSVLLIDADLRRPAVAEGLGLESAVGLTTVLLGRAQLRDAVQPVGHGDLDVLASGQLPPNPAEMLSSDAMQRLLTFATGQYDVVILDAPPLLPVTDAAVLSAMTAGVLLVVGADEVTKPQLREALAMIDQANGRTLGIVFNGERGGHDAYGYGHYRYRRHETQPGPSDPAGRLNLPDGTAPGHSHPSVGVPTPGARPTRAMN